MWFDVAAALAEIGQGTAATSATSATREAESRPMSQKSQMSQGSKAENRTAEEPFPDDLARELFKERAAIREHDGGLARAKAEAAALEEAAKATGMDPRALKLALARGP